jgi:AhpC/TSA family
MNEFLPLRQLIPPVTARTADGRTIRAWDYKQKNNLVIAFLHADCKSCGDWLAQMAERAADLSEHESVGLIVYAEPPPQAAQPIATPFVAATDATGTSQRAFLGRDAFGPAGLDRVGVFVTDRYGELYGQWVAKDASELPPLAEILSTLWQIQVAC